MSGYFLNRSSLQRDLEGLSRFHRAAFSAILAERLLPAYIQFAQEFNWGDPSVMLAAIDRVWNFVTGESISSDEAATLLKRIEDNAPDMDDFACDSRSLDTCSAIWAAVNACIDKSAKYALDTAKAFFGSACDFDLVDLNAADVDLYLAAQPAVLEAETFMRALLGALRTITVFDKTSISELRKSQTDNHF